LLSLSAAIVTMPKENRKRGRREEQKKRKRGDGDADHESKRHKKTDHEDPDLVLEDASYQDDAVGAVTRPGDMPFFGMLDEAEQEYFKQADEMLELNQFEGPDDRAMFLENVYKEAEGKELKIANSQSCSRLMERLILLSTSQQLKNLFKKFSGSYVVWCLYCRDALLTVLASSTSSNIDSPPTAARHSSSTLHPSSLRSSPIQISLQLRLLTPMSHMSQWRTYSSIPWESSKAIWDI
jgi:nucleolar protein 9